MQNKNIKENKMQTKNKTIADEMFEHANIINKASTTANLYGKLFALQEMQIYVLSEIKKVKELIERGQNE
jgi:CRISPR/Cas system-associated protein Cas5 (RAMP superfamily)